MKLKREKYNRSIFHYIKDRNIIFGFTEIRSDINDVARFFKVKKASQIDQVHGDKIYLSSNVTGYPKGDGIILNEKNIMAVIRTADCVPLFFRSKDGKTAGVIHIGWRGLHSKIGINLLNILRDAGFNSDELLFFTGPAIEGNCYTVQQDVVDKFKNFSFSKKIFKKTSEGYSMDVTKGIELCLIEQGVPKENITHSGICTFCNKNFPSYRRGDREKRIFNFIQIK